MKRHSCFTFLSVAPLALAQAVSSAPHPTQPTHKGTPGRFEIIGNTLVNSQQIFLGGADKVYILDKVENNAAQVNGHSAWASEYRLSDNTQRPMDVLTNSFCAGGSSLGNGTWVNVGGNQAVMSGGLAAPAQDGSAAPYHDADGRTAIRLLNPCDGNDCEWSQSPFEIEQRWYPTVETLEDGSVIILGGCRNGGFINDAQQSVPSYEFFPPNGPSVPSPVLENSLPANLYPLTWLLPSGKLLVQSNLHTILLDYKTNIETPLDNMPGAVRTYPASGGSVMLPLTPANNWTATVMFCGGANVPPDQWTNKDWVVISHPASNSCAKITPDISKSYVEEDPLPERRSLVNLILLPDGKVLCLNGAKSGMAGYGTNSWAIGQSYADNPSTTPVIYDPKAPVGQRWSSAGFAASTIPRMYHSSALLLPDGSIFVSGSNPNADFAGPTTKYHTEYRTERFYPPYYSKRRPEPRGLVSQLSYGGPAFDVVLDSQDLLGDVKNVENATVVVIRQGFSTHNINMGQRMLVLDSTYTGFVNNSAILHVSQLPPNPSTFAPGPAMLFVVVDGVPSVGVPVMVGNGKIGPQDIYPIGEAPASAIVQDSSASTGSAGGEFNRPGTNNGGVSARSGINGWGRIACIAVTVLASVLTI